VSSKTKATNDVTEVIDPVAEAAERLTAAEAAVKACAMEIATRAESVTRLIEESVDDDPSNDDEAAAQIMAAETALRLAEGRLPRLQEVAAIAEAEHRRLNTGAVLARVSADPAVTGEAQREIALSFGGFVTLAQAQALADLREVEARRAALAAQARAAGLPWAVDHPALNIRTARGLVPPISGLIPPSGPTSPEAVIAAVRTGTYDPEDMPVVELIDDADQVDDDDAAYGRELLSQVTGADVQPLTAYDPLDGGAYAAIRSIGIKDDRIVLDATLIGTRPESNRPEHGPVAKGAILVFSSQVDTRGRFTAEIIDPRRHDGPIDLVSVSNAVTAAIRAVPQERWPDVLQRSMDDDFVLSARVEAGDDPRTCQVRWTRTRDGATWPETLPIGHVRDALVGLPIAGAGQVRDVQVGEGGVYILIFNAAEDAEAASKMAPSNAQSH